MGKDCIRSFRIQKYHVTSCGYPNFKRGWKESMVFTSKAFIFLFMPLCAGIYYLLNSLEHCKKANTFCNRLRLKDWTLILFSLTFYSWAGILGLREIVIFALIIYAAAYLMSRLKSSGICIPLQKNDGSGAYQPCGRLFVFSIIFTFSIVFVVAELVLFKYPDVLARIWCIFSGGTISNPSILTPIGISFISFSAISYLTDIYRGQATAGSFVDCLFYILFFPKVISGPIVLWKDFQPYLVARTSNLQLTVTGINRIVCGLAKKAILADTFGAYLADFESRGMDSITALCTLILYTLQIYYDFSGYSDVAIGLSNMFGFEFKANFNFPYRSKSISEFWRRWHISLGTWFREYVYFPLGGSRCSKKRAAFNLGVVFALTGIWHGTGMNYLLWGLVNGLFVIGDHYWKDKPLNKKMPNFLKHISTMIIVILCWQLFRFNDLSKIGTLFGTILGTIKAENLVYTWRYYLDTRFLFLVIIGILGATVLGSPKLINFYKKVCAKPSVYIIQEALILVLLVLSILFIINSTYSPFIYFQY